MQTRADDTGIPLTPDEPQSRVSQILPDGLRDVETFLLRHRSTRVEVLTDRLVSTIVEQNPGYQATGVVPLADLRKSCHDNIIRVLELLVESHDDGSPHDGAAEETGRRRAEQGLPLDDLLRSFRLGGRLIWDDLIEQSRDAGALDADGLRQVGTRLWEVVDVSSARTAAAYHATERALARASEQRSAALWEELLAGRAREQGFAVTAAQNLGLPLHGRFLVVLLTSAVGDSDRRLRRHGITAVWHQRSDSVVGLLEVGTAGPSAAVEVLRQGARARGGVSRELTHVAAVADGFAQAALALRTLEPGTPGIARLDDRLVEALLLGSPEVAERLVAVWLGPLLALPSAEQSVLLTTVEAWAESGGSMTQAAERAHCHRNTAINRITRVGSVIGVRLTDGPVPLELTLALRSRHLRGGEGIGQSAHPGTFRTGLDDRSHQM